jgi:hypothetical protein
MEIKPGDIIRKFGLESFYTVQSVEGDYIVCVPTLDAKGKQIINGKTYRLHKNLCEKVTLDGIIEKFRQEKNDMLAKVMGRCSNIGLSYTEYAFIVMKVLSES